MVSTRKLTGALLLSSFAIVAALGATQGVRMQATIETFYEAADERTKEACKFKDDSSGMGGQSGSCAFVCAYPGTVALSVTAGDRDATVDGSVYCAEQYEWGCNGEKQCSRTAPIHIAGTGKCEGSSNEFWDSGLTVECTSRPDQQAAGGTDPPVAQEYCPVSVEPSPPYPRICINRPNEEHSPSFAAPSKRLLAMDTCRILDLRTGRTVCLDATFDMERLFRLSEHVLTNFSDQGNAHSGRVFVHSGLAVGLVCWGHDCVHGDVSVTFGSGGGGVRFSV